MATRVVCKLCEKKVYKLDKQLEFGKSTYHVACFRCSKCKKSLSTTNAKFAEDLIFCNFHFKKFNSPTKKGASAATPSSGASTPAKAPPASVPPGTPKTPATTSTASPAPKGTSTPTKPGGSSFADLAATAVLAKKTPGSASKRVKCTVCNRKVFSTDLTLEERPYHEKCLTCTKCKKRLKANMVVFTENAEMYCSFHFKKLFGKATPKKAETSKAAEEAAKKREEEESISRQRAAEELATKAAAEEAAKKKVEDEALAKKKAEEEAAKAKVLEAAKKKADEEAAVVKQKAEEQKKQEEEEEEEARLAEEAAAAKKKAEEAKKREEEAAKHAEEEAAKKKREEDEAQAKADEEAAKKKAEEDAAKKSADEEKRKQEEEAAKKAKEEEEQEEERKKRAKEEASKTAAEEAAKQKDEEEAAKKKKAEEEEARQAEEAAAKKKADEEEEEARQAEEAAAAAKKKEEEEEEEAQKRKEDEAAAKRVEEAEAKAKKTAAAKDAAATADAEEKARAKAESKAAAKRKMEEIKAERKRQEEKQKAKEDEQEAERERKKKERARKRQTTAVSTATFDFEAEKARVDAEKGAKPKKPVKPSAKPKNKCKLCDQEALPTEDTVKVGRETYHSLCLFCKKCEKVLAPAAAKQDSMGVMMCSKHFGQLAPKPEGWKPKEKKSVKMRDPKDVPARTPSEGGQVSFTHMLKKKKTAAATFCKQCDTKVEEGDAALELKRRVYHRRCFFCTKCKHILGDAYTQDAMGFVHCGKHFQKLTENAAEYEKHAAAETARIAKEEEVNRARKEQAAAELAAKEHAAAEAAQADRDYVASKDDSGMREDIMAVVTELLAAMKAQDAAGIQALFTSDAKLYSVDQTVSGPPSMASTPVEAFTRVVSVGVHDEVLPEGAIVRLAGCTASVWCPYTLSIDAVAAHDGVNSFTMFRQAGEWRISAMTDTRHAPTKKKRRARAS